MPPRGCCAPPATRWSRRRRGTAGWSSACRSKARPRRRCGRSPPCATPRWRWPMATRGAATRASPMPGRPGCATPTAPPSCRSPRAARVCFLLRPESLLSDPLALDLLRLGIAFVAGRGRTAPAEEAHHALENPWSRSSRRPISITGPALPARAGRWDTRNVRRCRFGVPQPLPTECIDDRSHAIPASPPTPRRQRRRHRRRQPRRIFRTGRRPGDAGSRRPGRSAAAARIRGVEGPQRRDRAQRADDRDPALRLRHQHRHAGRATLRAQQPAAARRFDRRQSRRLVGWSIEGIAQPPRADRRAT